MNAPNENSRTFVAGLVAEMQAIFAGLGEQGALESESQGKVDIVTLLRLALKSELEASELAGHWMPTTPEIDAKMAFARQCGDEMKHYDLIAKRLGAPGGASVGRLEAPTLPRFSSQTSKPSTSR